MFYGVNDEQVSWNKNRALGAVYQRHSALLDDALKKHNYWLLYWTKHDNDEHVLFIVKLFPLEKKKRKDEEFLYALNEYRFCLSISIIRTFLVIVFEQNGKKHDCY